MSKTMQGLAIDKKCDDTISSLCHVLIENKEFCSCTLNLTELKTNSNKFFIMQLLERNDRRGYFIFTRSGRVGYGGVDHLDCILDKETAVREFRSIFEEKTAVSWEDRYEMEAEFGSGKYNYVEMKSEGRDIDKIEDELIEKIHLDLKVQQLIGIIFDKKTFDDMATKFNLDAKRAPLGTISSNQISKAYNILNRISKNLEDYNESEFMKATSEFYSVIPTNFGLSKPPLLNNEDILKEKIELLKILGDVEAAARIMKNTVGSAKEIEKKYYSLKCDMKPLENPERIKLIRSYFNNTKGSTHSIGNYLTIRDIYEVDRGEPEFNSWKGLHNHQLLWHGSRLVNYVGILSQGLRINPSNVVKTGSMFGNGLYFANSSTKSANYMVSSNGIGIMLLCEVALGKCYEKITSEYVTKLPDGCHSTRGIGKVIPDESTHVVVDDNIIVPNGKLIENKEVNAYLQYDEFIVYDMSQVKIRYLLLLNTK